MITDVAAAPGTATVRTGAGTRLRVRSGPGTNYPIVARLNNGQSVALLGRNAGGDWLLVATPGDDSPFGWVAAAILATSATVDDLPVSSAAPLPTATAGVAPAAAPTVAPSPGPLPGKLAVPVFDSEQGIYNIWLVNADGTNLRQVVRTPAGRR